MAEPKITKELIQKAMACETPEQLIELAKAEGLTVTKEEAEAFIAQTQDVELDSVDLQAAAGGGGCPIKRQCNVRDCEYSWSDTRPSADCWQKQ